MRLDVYLSELEGVGSRSQAVHLIKMNKIIVDGQVCTKPAQDVENKKVEIINKMEFVSMGGYKLDKAIKELNISVSGNTCLDIGASNGGFTHCLLTHGASLVYALDVGDTALPPELLNDSRVIVKDKFNARDISPQTLGASVDMVVIDVSFISLSLVLQPAISVLKEGGSLVALVKPQFEVGKKNLTKKGIVIDKKSRDKAVDIIISMAEELGLDMLGKTEAPIREGKNLEYLIYLCKKESKLV